MLYVLLVNMNIKNKTMGVNFILCINYDMFITVFTIMFTQFNLFEKNKSA